MRLEQSDYAAAAGEEERTSERASEHFVILYFFVYLLFASRVEKPLAGLSSLDPKGQNTQIDRKYKR